MTMTALPHARTLAVLEAAGADVLEAVETPPDHGDIVSDYYYATRRET